MWNASVTRIHGQLNPCDVSSDSRGHRSLRERDMTNMKRACSLEACSELELGAQWRGTGWDYFGGDSWV